MLVKVLGRLVFLFLQIYYVSRMQFGIGGNVVEFKDFLLEKMVFPGNGGIAVALFGIYESNPVE